MRALRVVDPRGLAESVAAAMREAWASMRQRAALPLAAELATPDRRALDDAVLAAHGVAETDRAQRLDELHATMLELVRERLAKADRVPG